MEQQPIYSVIDAPSNAEKLASYEKSTPWKNSNISFNWTNFDYPFLHAHQHWEAFLIVEGTIVHHLNGKQQTMTLGEACIIRPSDKHKLCSTGESPVKTINFIFKADCFESLCRFYDIDLVDKKNDLSFKVSASRLREVVNETILIQSLKNVSIRDKEARCKSILARLVGDYVEQKVVAEKNVPQWVEKLLVTLSNPLLSETSIKKNLAATTNYSYSNMIRLFKKYTGYTIVEYVHIKKIDYAAELLIHTDKRIIEISSLLGYDSLSHFNRLFKRYTGLTPTEYKKKKR